MSKVLPDMSLPSKSPSRLTEEQQGKRITLSIRLTRCFTTRRRVNTQVRAFKAFPKDETIRCQPGFKPRTTGQRRRVFCTVGPGTNAAREASGMSVKGDNRITDRRRAVVGDTDSRGRPDDRGERGRHRERQRHNSRTRGERRASAVTAHCDCRTTDCTSPYISGQLEGGYQGVGSVATAAGRGARWLPRGLSTRETRTGGEQTVPYATTSHRRKRWGEVRDGEGGEDTDKKHRESYRKGVRNCCRARDTTDTQR
ncbi:hypothetical protein ElyMa_002685800 [Elysia marginata]|uniref:Uncharacterized protein n=1 Tax=Elysia marginata TaxID=1093978 RepID=A0AAV4HB60_9GAST|nr:hypothetical protein ElyMa_002685800 [Elysia marginata]